MYKGEGKNGDPGIGRGDVGTVAGCRCGCVSGCVGGAGVTDWRWKGGRKGRVYRQKACLVHLVTARPRLEMLRSPSRTSAGDSLPGRWAANTAEVWTRLGASQCVVHMQEEDQIDRPLAVGDFPFGRRQADPCRTWIPHLPLLERVASEYRRSDPARRLGANGGCPRLAGDSP